MNFDSSLVILLVTATIAGLARGFSGFGGALIFVPIAARLLGPQIASPLLLIADSLVVGPLVYNAWPKARLREVLFMTAGAIIGAPAGTWILRHTEANTMRWGIAILALAMLGLLISGWRFNGKPHPNLTTGVGAVSGLLSGIAQIGGPPVVAYWLGSAEKAATMRASIIIFFAFGSVITFISYAASGLLTTQVWWLSLAVAPAFGIGLLFGSKMFGLASEVTFRRICLTLIAVAVLFSLPVWG